MVVYHAVQGGSKFWVCGWNPKVRPFKWKLLSSTFLWCCLLCCTNWFHVLSVWMKSLSAAIRMKATEQFFPVVRFIILYKLVPRFECVDEILKCSHSNESLWLVLSCDAVYYVVHSSCNYGHLNDGHWLALPWGAIKKIPLHLTLLTLSGNAQS